MKNQSWLIIKSFRPANLLMLALTMCLVRHFVVLQVLQQTFRLPSSIAEWQFALMVIGTLFIAASGYLLNDFFDRDIDEINHGSNKPTLHLTETTIVATCLILDLIGIGLGYLVFYWAGNVRMATIFVLAAALLLIYSKFLKKYGPLGNIAVSLLAAVVVLLPALVEQSLLHPDVGATQQVAKYVWQAVGAYALFSFLITMAREVAKDTEDMQGDRLGGRKTIPIIAGEKAGKFAVVIFLLLMIRALVGVQQVYIKDHNFLFVGYIVLLIEVPAIVAMVLMYMANSVKEYHRTSLLLKAIMLMGVLSMLLYNFV